MTWAALIAIAAIAAVAIVVVVDGNPADPPGEGASGSGVTHDGRFYLLSDAVVRGGALGPPVAQQVQMMDFTTDLRSVRGQPAQDVLAAQVPGSAGPRWQLIAADPDTAADPWSDDGVADLVEPQG